MPVPRDPEDDSIFQSQNPKSNSGVGGSTVRREGSVKFTDRGLLCATRTPDSKQTMTQTSTPTDLTSHPPDTDREHIYEASDEDDLRTYNTSPYTTPYSSPDTRNASDATSAGGSFSSQALTSVPASPLSLRWDSLNKEPDAAHDRYDRPINLYPSSPVSSIFPSTTLSSTNSHQLYNIDSLAVEARDGFSPPLVGKRNTSESAMAVGNFSRPRAASGKQLRYQDFLGADNSNHHHLDATSNSNSTAYKPRDRGQSISSNKSISTLASAAVRPFPDTHYRDSNRGRSRHQHGPPSTRHPISSNRTESTEPSYYTKELPLYRMASMPTDELRSSYRSQLSASTAQGTLVTERSSVLTKTSSITSLSGHVDDGLSVEDVMGMYEKGFVDDNSAPEDNDLPDSRPTTAKSELHRRGTALLEAMSEPLPMPISDKVTANVSVSGLDYIVRDSAAIFRNSGLPTTVPEELGGGLDVFAEQHTQEIQATDQAGSARPRPQRQMTNFTITGHEGRDRYGFKKGNQYITREQYEEWDVRYTDYLARRRRKWNAFLKESGLMTDIPNRFPPRSAKTKRFVRKGIPPEWRGAAWFYYAGGPAIVAKHAGVYDDLVRRPAKDVDVEAIERDLHRTFPDNIKFRSSQPSWMPVHASQALSENASGPVDKEGETPLISSLRRVLHAFSIYNPKIGYCQSLNFLAGLLLLFVETEEQAFWLLNIITRVHLPGTHETSLEGANVDLGVLMSSIKESMPGVWNKIGGGLDGTGVTRTRTMRRQKQRDLPEMTGQLPPITLCMTAWFMSCFVGTLPIESALRVWDVFFYEGSKTLFRIALAVFKVGESEIKSVKDPMEIFQVVQTIPRRLINANGLMEACFKRRNGFGHISQETIEEKRRERRIVVKAQREMLAGGGSSVTGGMDEDTRRKGGTLFGRRKGRDRSLPSDVTI